MKLPITCWQSAHTKSGFCSKRRGRVSSMDHQAPGESPEEPRAESQGQQGTRPPRRGVIGSLGAATPRWPYAEFLRMLGNFLLQIIAIKAATERWRREKTDQEPMTELRISAPLQSIQS